MNVLLLSDDPDFTSALPALELRAHVVNVASPTDDSATSDVTDVDVAIIDARTDLVGARDTCRHLVATAPAVAAVIFVAVKDLVTLDADWRFDDVVLATSSAAELHGRLRLVLARRRNTSNRALEVLRFGDLALHPSSYTAALRGRKVDLTLIEFQLLNYLVQHAGCAMTRTRLVHEVWGRRQCCHRTVDVHVQRLRAKLGEDYESMVETVRGVGYMAVNPPCPSRATGEPVLATVRAS